MPTTQEHLDFYTNVFDTIDYKNVYQNPKNFAFDEWPGMSTLYTVKNKKVYNHIEEIADLSYHCWHFLPSEEGYRRKNNVKEWNTYNIVYLFDNGKLYKVGINNGKVNYTETMYVHFQKRKVIPANVVTDKFLILPPGKIVTEIPEITPKYLKRVAREKRFYFASEADK